MDTPVALIIFNRPELTKKVFEEIAKAKPRKLFVIADGPRHAGDEPSVLAAREVVNAVDWECEVFRDYAETNLGCGNRPATGISWVFEHVDRAIILEDDCIPHTDFFPFCSELLDRYADDRRIMQINGNNFQQGKVRGSASYFFSRHSICWGWATWRRAWALYDREMRLWPDLREGPWLEDILKDKRAVKFYRGIFERSYRGNVSWWDFQWTFACWVQHGLVISPNTTLVSNEGFGEKATHTRNTADPWANLQTASLRFPLRHPPHLLPDLEAERFMMETFVRKVAKAGLARRWVRRQWQRVKRGSGLAGPPTGKNRPS
jgi:hypothetical protein